MWGDSPHLKNVFIRVSRGVIITDQVGGTVPPRGQTRKVPRPQKFLNPIFSKTGRQIFIVQYCRPQSDARDGPHSTINVHTVTEKFEFFQKNSTVNISKTVCDELWPRYFSGSRGRDLDDTKVWCR